MRSMPTDLDLVVGASHMFQLTIGGPPSEIAGAEHDPFAAEEWIGHVALGRQGRIVEVAGGYTVATAPHLAHLTDTAWPPILSRT